MQLKFNTAKNIILVFMTAFTFSCKAQSPVIDVYGTIQQNIKNAYYKDIDNFNDQFVGTWVFDDGTTYLKVIFKKKPMFYENFTKNYVDYLVGEYEYKLNNISKVNSLNNLDNNHTDILDYNLVSRSKLDRNFYPYCADCTPTEKRLFMIFGEQPSRDSRWGPDADFVMRRVVEGGVEKLKVQFVGVSSATRPPSPELAYFSLPFGNYTLIKQ